MLPLPHPSLHRWARHALIAACLIISATAQAPAVGPTRQAAVVSALDLNHDGTIDAAELDQAPATLKKLDRNGDGNLTRDEYRQGRAEAPASPPASPPAPAPPASPGKPNILILMADDLGWNGVGFHAPSAPTPNLNQLAKEGLELRRFYTYPVCSPSRAALLTGVMPLRYGIVDALGPRQAGIPNNTSTLPSTLRAAGYQTSLIGKWHLGSDNPPLKCGFDHFYGFLGPQIDYFTHIGLRDTLDWQRDGKDLEESGYSTYLLADEAIRQLQHRDPKRPFFMEIAFNAPHVPLGAPAELLAKHERDGGVYPAVIEAMDIAIGRVLTALKEQGLSDNTLVVFFSDNGASRRYSDNTPLAYGKDTVYEGGIRTPCIVRWPGQVPGNSKCEQPVAVHDLFPTLIQAAGLTLPATAKPDGTSQWPAIHTGRSAERPPILIASHDSALIAGDWKFIQWEDGKQSLFNLTSDTGESEDQLATQPEVTKRLAAQLAAMKKDLPASPARRSRPSPGGGKR